LLKKGPTEMCNYRMCLLAAVPLSAAPSVSNAAAKPAAGRVTVSGLVIPLDDSSMYVRLNTGEQKEIRWTNETRVALSANWRQIDGTYGVVKDHEKDTYAEWWKGRKTGASNGPERHGGQCNPRNPRDEESNRENRYSYQHSYVPDAP